MIDQLYANNWERLNQLEAKGGMYDNKMSYSFSDTLRMVYYQGAKIETDVVSLSTVNDAISYMDKKVEAGNVDITLFCSKDLFYFLLKSVKENNFFGDGMDCVYDLICQAGIYDYDLDIFRKIYAIHVHVNKLYPGFEIAQAVKKNKENDLSDKLKRTLDEARKMADSCKTSNKTEMAGKIHDAICQRTRYETKSEKSENDTAIGVLLNGRSDCDGYSDAFYLVGTLTGLRIRFQHGDAVNSGFYGFMDSTTHMWNLIELDGTWRLVDLTWDDSDKEISKTWFNLGDDRASRSHIWNREMSVVLLEKTDLGSRPVNEFSVTTSEEMEDAVVKALDQRFSRFDLIFDDASFIAKDEALRFIRQRFNGSISYLWDEDMRLLTIYVED